MRLSGHETVLVCQDTSDLVYTTLRRTRGLGPISDPSGKGIKVHTALCVSDAGVPLGVLQQKSWTRDMQSRRPGRRRGIEEKESYRWLECLEAVQQQVPEATRVITIADREGDIYELFAHPRRANSELLIRAAQNRSTKSEPGASEIKALFKVMETIAVSGEMTIALQRTPRRAPREATLSVRYTRLWLQPPQGKGHLGAIPISVIMAKEEKRPEKEAAVEWMLLATLAIGSLEAAKENLRRYALRWLIERLHYILKSGCGVEALQLKRAEGLQRALATYTIVAWRLLWLSYEARQNREQTVEGILERHQWEALFCRVHRTTQPPKEAPTLGQSIEWIAQLGGYLNRKGDGNPGVKTLWRGLQRLHDMATTWFLLEASLSCNPQTG
ncbi:IS4 family transposase [Pseudanabaena sp. FACHB-2040]|uniref:IS4 family transposase n=1 Tax=Pseudanabaena sp. FACHB-2040 TaxID=2692859 RepID=UPI001F54E555|nr:IS4 family transposase [Pseudanabaena sp. FACHB-2040]